MADETPESDQPIEDAAEEATAPEAEAPAAEEAPVADETPAEESAPVAESEEAAAAEETPAAEEAPAAEETPAAEATEEPAAEAEAEPAAEESATTEESDGESVPELTLGSGEGVVESGEISQPQTIRGKIDRFGTAIGTGRRKTSVARVRIKDGSGQLTINGRALEEYFTIERDRNLVMAPLKATESTDSVDVWVRVNGGGTTGQAGAIVLGIARALQARNSDLHHTLSSGGYLSRDGRMVERKKYGYKKARKSFQFSKR